MALLQDTVGAQLVLGQILECGLDRGRVGLGVPLARGVLFSRVELSRVKSSQRGVPIGQGLLHVHVHVHVQGGVHVHVHGPDPAVAHVHVACAMRHVLCAMYHVACAMQHVHLTVHGRDPPPRNVESHAGPDNVRPKPGHDGGKRYEWRE